ncbi:hypothetical protein [Intestinibacter bartlettii]|uniref:hypothetical protein n=1 Tax=Intestinibacter bartlettii TaxID=261299 RepID=UPI003991EFEE
MKTEIILKILKSDGFNISQEDEKEIHKMILNKHLYPYIIGCNILNVNGKCIKISRKEFDTKNNTVSLFLSEYVENDGN